MTESAIQYRYVYLVAKRFEAIYAETRKEADSFFREKFGFEPDENQFIERQNATP